jgi:photosystem II stability/assembly factor-like uncharacterized protein
MEPLIQLKQKIPVFLVALLHLKILSARPSKLTILLISVWTLVTMAARAEEWISIGPFGTLLANGDVISGQTNAVAVDPHDANTLFVAAAEGGLWRTKDGGANWQAVADNQLVRKILTGLPQGTLSTGAVAIDPQNSRVVYVGTGDSHMGAVFAGPSLGVFRSMDGGDTWTPTGVNLGQCDNGAMSRAVVNRMLIVPRGPRTLPPVSASRAARSIAIPGLGEQPARVFAATNLGLFVYLEDGSDCWKRLTDANGLPKNGGAIDMVADPYRNVLYVSFYTLGIFKSTDLTGTQWKQLTNGLPTSDFGWIALAFGGRTGVGFSEPLPLLYAGYRFQKDQYRLFKTVNGGDAWTELPAPPNDGQLDFNNTLAVGSYDPNELYLGQVGLWRALDGGAKGSENDFKADPQVTNNSWTGLSCCLSFENPFRLGMDLHADNHDIQFAPYGSFLPAPDQVEVFYVANDGGLAKGKVDYNGVVTWKSLTKGLAISQAGTIALAPGNPLVTVAGVWHNGNLLNLSDINSSMGLPNGDGFQVAIDAGIGCIYFNCNAGYGGAICRLISFPPSFNNPQWEFPTIWSDNSTTAFWADPHRPGHLLRLQKNGLLFRTKVASSATPQVLDTADAWEAVDPFWGKVGNTTTMAFRSRVLEETPVYYIGTDGGQVWRGSPEVAWVKLCDCGGKIIAIAPDLFQNERIFVVLNNGTTKGRIKQISRAPNDTWTATDIDNSFPQDLQINVITSVAVDPTVQGANGTTIYVGTDQGIFRGHVDGPPVLNPGEAANFVHPPIVANWTWRRSPGVPNVLVTDLKVHQNFYDHDHSGVVRAGTYGRGIFELRRVSWEEPPITLTVQAIQIGQDGAPTPLTVTIPVSVKAEKANRKAPFEFAAKAGTEASLEAPKEVRRENEVFRFIGWALPGQRSKTNARITLKLNQAARAIAYYEKVASTPDAKAKPVQIAVSTNVKQICVPSLSHEFTVSWEVSEGQRPVHVRAEITYPEKRTEGVELKPINGSRSFPVNYPNGGEIKVHMIADDGTKQNGTADSIITLKPCKK